ncbi:MAG: putative sulfate exporter family transporter [Candidatus Rokubacteria bacterium]|nr:putative sulfate exporter family transporter [Candidatus Rokubacteria bacterium]
MARAEAEHMAERQANRAFNIFFGLLIIAVLAWAANYLTHWSPKAMGAAGRALEYPIWAAGIGLIVNLVLTAAGVWGRVSPAFRTELFLKTGLVTMGASLNFFEIVAIGAKGVVQAVIGVTLVWFFAWWLGGKMRLDDKLRAVMATSVSICGVSAAIAATGSVLAKKEQLSYTVALVLLFALPLMVLMPWMVGLLGLNEVVGGAWIGGNIDTTAAVVGAGSLAGKEALKVATVVKLSQNAIIGFAAFFLALYWVLAVERKPNERPSPMVIWHRFPKFVLGFIVASIIGTAGVFTKTQLSAVSSFSKWCLLLAFVSIGLEFAFREFGKVGWKPFSVYAGATVFNLLVGLGLALLIFGGYLGI